MRKGPGSVYNDRWNISVVSYAKVGVKHQSIIILFLEANSHKNTSTALNSCQMSLILR